MGPSITRAKSKFFLNNLVKTFLRLIYFYFRTANGQLTDLTGAKIDYKSPFDYQVIRNKLK